MSRCSRSVDIRPKEDKTPGLQSNEKSPLVDLGQSGEAEPPLGPKQNDSGMAEQIFTGRPQDDLMCAHARGPSHECHPPFPSPRAGGARTPTAHYPPSLPPWPIRASTGPIWASRRSWPTASCAQSACRDQDAHVLNSPWQHGIPHLPMHESTQMLGLLGSTGLQ